MLLESTSGSLSVFIAASTHSEPAEEPFRCFLVISDHFHVPVNGNGHRWSESNSRLGACSGVVPSSPAPRRAVERPAGLGGVRWLNIAHLRQLVLIGDLVASSSLSFGVDIGPGPYPGYTPASDVGEWFDEDGEDGGQGRKAGASYCHSHLEGGPHQGI